MASLLATGTSLASSADFVLSGETTSLFLVSTDNLPSACAVTVSVKGANGKYYPIGALTNAQPFLVLSSPGTFNVTRPANSPNCGVDRV